MSHTLYDPFAYENQSPTQEQDELSNKPIERDPQGASSNLAPGPSFSSSGTSSATPASSGGMLPSLPPQLMNYRPEQSRTITGKNTESSLDMQSIPGLGGIDCPAQDKPAPPTESAKSATDVLLHFGLDEEDLDHLISYPEDQITPANLPFILQEIRTEKTKKAASAVQSVPFAEPHPTRSVSGMDGQSLSSSGGAGKSVPPASDFPSSTDAMHPIPFQTLPPFNRHPLAKVSPVSKDQPTATMLQDYQQATQSLSSSGGTEELVPPASVFPISTDAMQPFPIQMLPPSNRQPLAKVSPVSKELPTATMLQDYPSATSSLCSSGGAGMYQKELSSVVLQSKETDYGYNSKYSEGVGDETASTSSSRADSGGSGSMLLMNTPNSSRHSRESVQKNVRELKRIVLGFSCDQTFSVSTFSSSHSSILSSVDHSSNDWTTQMQTQPNQTSQSILSSFSLPKNDTDTHVLKSSTPKPAFLNQPEVGCQSTLKTQPLPAVNPCVNPSQPGLVIVDKNEASVAKDHSDIKGQGSTAEQIIKQHTQQQQQKQPVSLTGQTICPPASPASDSPNTTDIMQPVPIQTLQPSNRQPPVKVSPSSKDVPLGLKLQDYAAATPRSFPHTCSLCNKECIHMKDWISHLNTSLHLENCQVLQKEAPGRRERGGREKRSSRSRSPHSSRCNRRSRSCSSSSGSCSSSLERQSSQRRRDDKRSSPRRGNDIRSSPRRSSESGSQSKRIEKRRSPPRRSEKRRTSPRRSEKRRTPPRRSENRRTPPRRNDETQSSPRRSEKRRSPPKRSDEKRSPPRSSDEKQSPPRRSDEKQSPPRRSDEKQSPLRRGEKKHSPPRRGEERKSPPKTSDPRPSLQEKKLNTAEIFATKLLEASAVQSLSTPSELQNVAKLLAPAILVEITKMSEESSVSSSSSTASSSSFSSAAKKKFTKKLLKAKPSLQTSEASSSTKAKCGKSSPPTMVKLQGIDSSVTLNDVLEAVENYGKTKSCLLFRSKQGAVVCFEKEEDAKKLKSVDSFNVKDTTVTVVKEQDTVSKEQQRPLQNKPSMSSVSTSQATTTTKVLLPQSNIHLSKNTNVSTKQMASENKLQEVVPKDTAKVVEKTSVTGFEPKLQADHDKANNTEATKPMEIGEMGVEVSEPMEDGDFAEIQEEKTTTSEVVPENSNSLKSLKQRLQDCSEITIKFEPDTISVKAKPQTVKSQTQPPTSKLLDDGSQHFQQTSGPCESTISEPITAGPSATATSDVEIKEEDEKPGTEATMDSTDGPEANEDVEKAEVKAEEESLTTSIPSDLIPDVTSTSAVSSENIVPAPTSPAPSATISVAAKPAAVKSQTQPPPSELSENGSQPSLQTSGPGESTISEPITAGPSVTMASDEAMNEDEGCPFNEQNFNMDDFITVDEVGDVEDIFPEPHSSSASKESSREQIEKQSSGLSSTGKGTSTNTSKDSKTSSYSSKSTKGSSSSKSSSVTPKTTESETKIGTSSAVHLPQQGHGLKPDSVKDETARDEPTMITRSTRAKRQRTTKQDASNEKPNIVGMSTRRSTRAGESQEQKKEKTPKKEEKTPPKRSTPSKKNDSVLREISKEDCDVFDSMKDEVVPTDLPAARRKRGRPRKDVKRVRKDSATLKNDDQDASEKMADKEATYQITDDNRTIGQSEEKNSQNNDQQTKKSASLTAPPKNEKKEEPEAQVGRVVEDQEGDVEITGRELQALVTLDPFVEDEDGKTNESMLETHPTSQPDTETSVTLDKAGDEEEKPQEEQTAKIPTSGKRKRDDDTVGKSTRGKKVTAKDEKEEEREPACTDVLPSTPLDASSSLDKDPSLLSSVSHLEVQVEVEADIDAASAGQELQPEHPENQTPEDGEEWKEGWSEADDKDYKEPVGPEAKRSRSQSPCATASGGALAFQPNDPFGQEFVVPTVGNSCNPHYVSFTSDDLHCSIQSHSHDLQPCCSETRIQLYDVTRKRLHDNDMADPNNWGKIATIRPGRVPVHSPYLHMNARTATEIKARSKLVTCFAVETPHKPATLSDVRVTIYDHLEGPWAEIEEINKAEGPRLMAYLVAPPQDTHLIVPRGYYHTVTQPIQKRKRIRGKRGKIRK